MLDARRFQARLWADGDYPQLAPLLQEVSDAVVEAVQVSEGSRVLDLGAGAGDTAVAAAIRGARVTAAELSSTWFDACRERATNARVEVEWREVDPLDLPFADEQFECVTSANAGAVLFSPPHLVARQIVRVCAPGARIALANWTGSGTAGRVSILIAPYLPPPPKGAAPGVWADEERLASLFGPLGLKVASEKRDLRLSSPSVDEFVDYMERVHGPLICAKRAALEQRAWDELRAAISAVYSDVNLSSGGGLSFDQEYLLAIGHQR